MEKIVFNVKEVTKYLSVSESTIRKLVRKKRFHILESYPKYYLTKNKLISG